MPKAIYKILVCFAFTCRHLQLFSFVISGKWCTWLGPLNNWNMTTLPIKKLRLRVGGSQDCVALKFQSQDF